MSALDPGVFDGVIRRTKENAQAADTARARSEYTTTEAQIVASTCEARYGALPEEWAHWDVVLGLTVDLLPVVSNPKAVISPESSLKALGKTPSRYNASKQVVGFGKWTEHRTAPGEITAWAKEKDYGICLQTRTVRALDVDIPDAVLANEVRELIGKQFALPTRTRADSEKFLCLFELVGDYARRRLRTADGFIELLATGQQAVVVGTHPSGARYEWEGGLPDAVPVVSSSEFESLWSALTERFGVEAPTESSASTRSQKMADAVAADAVVAHLEARGLVHSVGRDGRVHITCPWESEHSGGAAGDTSTTYWPAHTGGYARGHFHCFHAHCSERTDAEFLQAIGYREALSPPGEATEAAHSDAGNVDVLAEIADGNLKYVPEQKLWLHWTGERWERDSSEVAATSLARRVAMKYRREAEDFTRRATKNGLDTADRKRLERVAESLQKWAVQCENRGRIDSMLNLASRDARFVLPSSVLDANPAVIGVANGVIDLKTGRLRPAAREEFVTKRCSVPFDPSARAPRFEKFVEEVTGRPAGRDDGWYSPRPALAAYLHRALGYALTGSVVEQKMFIAVGGGSNGKSVLLDIVAHVMGDYAVEVTPDALMASKRDNDAERATPGLKRLAGARLARSSESKEGQRLDEALVKRHTGDATMTARGNYQDPITFAIQHKLWLQTNALPTLEHLDQAMQDRLHLVRFDMRWNRPGVVDPDPNLPTGDKHLADTLRAEAPGVLAWLVEGARMYYAEGLEPPEEVRSQTREYLDDQDPFRQWLSACARCAPREGTAPTALLENFEVWCSATEMEAPRLSVKAFAKKLKDHGIESDRTSDRRMYGLRPAAVGVMA